jgi:hypothetical protein
MGRCPGALPRPRLTSHRTMVLITRLPAANPEGYHLGGHRGHGAQAEKKQPFCSHWGTNRGCLRGWWHRHSCLCRGMMHSMHGAQPGVPVPPRSSAVSDHYPRSTILFFPISNLPSQIWDIIRHPALPHVKFIIFKFAIPASPPP